MQIYTDHLASGQRPTRFELDYASEVVVLLNTSLCRAVAIATSLGCRSLTATN